MSQVKKTSIFLQPVLQQDRIPLNPTCDHCKRPDCANGVWYQLLNGSVVFFCKQCLNLSGTGSRIEPIGFPIYKLKNGILKKIELTLTEKLRISSRPMYGKRIRFKIKKGRRVERVNGRFRGIFHHPQKGFVIDVDKVTINGHYYGMTFSFPMRQIIWISGGPLIKIPALPKVKKNAP